MEESRRKSILPLTVAKKSAIPVAAQQDRVQTSTCEPSTTLTTSDTGLKLLALGKSRSVRRKGPENHVVEPGLGRKGSIYVDSKAPRASGIIPPRLNYDKTPSRSFSKQTAQLSDGPGNINAATNYQSEAEDFPKISCTTRSGGHERSVSVTRPARAGNTLLLRGRSSSKQISASHTPSMNMLPPKQDQRPAFSTLQQHFTPKKSSKASTTSFFAPPPSNQELDDKSISAIARLQMELAQLHLLHRDSNATQAQWENSAERSLRSRFECLSRQHVELKEIACESQALINQSALLVWCQQLSDVEIAEKVQLLSRCILDIGSILDSESKLPRVLRLFEAWSDRASRIHESRRYSDHAASLSLDFVENIGDGWRAEVDSINKKLSSLSRELDSLGEVREESSVGRVLVMLKSIVSNILVELGLISSMEYEIMTQEISWVQDKIGSLADDVDRDIAASYKGVWHDEE